MTDKEVEPDALPLFRALSSSKRSDLLRNAMVHGVASGTVLFEQGDVPNFQLIVLSGSVQLFGRSNEGREVLIEAVRAPDLIIPAAVVTGAPYLMQARVPEPSRFLLIHAAVFRTAVEADPLLAHAVIGSLAQQFRRMVRQVKSLKLRSSTQRVGCYVLALSKRQGTPDRAVLPFEKTLIASELGITRESFSRALAKLGRSSIRVNGQTIAILDAPGLAAECKPDPLIDGADIDDFIV
ncbi:cyclic nucleotide-binding domain-containing protein [Mesorhizobium sp. B1-1-6]|uniref:cyclic nucleotide-binding domain-containing protein n=1 Tax=Mesorhizobium sp. B1-1-6 TaxID=2589978 RepID=UPI001127ABDC|nr:cyclic nucleotide-binding domain-containing protein [Mesorhizobium sp. B1-1-6]TPN35411.1 cyclic nucleotide-binding domain-containing protein [Mesorhizobium sp. B1-1-6]